MTAPQATTPTLARRQDWPERLAEQIAAAQARPYELGRHDCLRFACACIEAMTGVDYWPRFSGYKTKLQALRTIAQIAPTLGEAVTAVLAVPPERPAMARRGDVLLYQDEQGEHLAVCAGATCAVLAPDGLRHVRLDHAGLKYCWRVG